MAIRRCKMLGIVLGAAAVSYSAFEVRIAAADWDALSACTKQEYRSCVLVDGEYDRPAHCDYVAASCSYDGGPTVGCKVRRKGGSTWRPLDEKPSLKIKKMELENGDDYTFDTFVCGRNVTCTSLPGGALSGSDTNVWQSSKVTLNNDVLGSASVDAYRAFRDIGVVAPLARHVAVRLYRDDTLKVHARYTMVETINDKAFAKKYIHADNYALFEFEGGMAEFKRSGGCYEDGLVDCGVCNVQTNQSICGPPGGTALHDVPLSKFNPTYMQRYYAGELITNHWDGVCSRDSLRPNNAYVGVYPDASGADVFAYIASGADRTYRCGEDQLTEPDPKCAPLIECFGEPGCRASFASEYEAARKKAHRVHDTDCLPWYSVALIVSCAVLIVLILVALSIPVVRCVRGQ